MNWLSQNWLWLLLAAGALFFFRRGGLAGCGHSHGGHHRRDEPRGDSQVPANGPSRTPESPAVVATDPVTRESVVVANALTSVYLGQTYYFKTAENRQRFETSPEQFASHDHPASSGTPHEHHGRRRQGC